MKPPSKTPSAYLGSDRDDWWHDDFIELMCRRWDLGPARSLLDVGCGLGQWSRLLARHLASLRHLVGVDTDASYLRAVQEMPEPSLQEFPPLEPVMARAQHLPFPSGAFDAATCQTLLIHVPAPMAVLREMARVTRPRGWIICAEPNNLIPVLDFSDTTLEAPPETTLRIFELWLRYRRGRMLSGQGDLALGAYLPGLFSSLALEDIQIHHADRGMAYVPPYRSPSEQHRLAADRDPDDGAIREMDYANVRDAFLAGGGDASTFDACWKELVDSLARRQRALDRREHTTSGASGMVLVAGRKP